MQYLLLLSFLDNFYMPEMINYSEIIKKLIICIFVKILKEFYE